MDVAKAAYNTLTIWGKKVDGPLPAPIRNPGGEGLPHQHWILLQVREGLISHEDRDSDILAEEKAHRWLGYAQGYLVAGGQLTLDDCKYANMLS